MSLALQPIDFSEACAFVVRLHRHHKPPIGSKLQVAVNDGEKIVGVAIAGRPVGRFTDDGTTLEVTRCCTDGTRNACSILYAAAWRATKALGYVRMVTYTLPEEGGASLKAAGWKFVGMGGKVGGGGWSCPSRPRLDNHPTDEKWRWEVTAGPTGTVVTRFRIKPAVERIAGLFDNPQDTRPVDLAAVAAAVTEGGK